MRSDVVARPVTFDRMRSVTSGLLLDSDRTRPVAVGAYWTPTGHQVQRVRSDAGARPIRATTTFDAHCSRLSCSDRTRPVTLTSVSGQYDFNCVIR
jgi:hypothetical protein